MSPSLKRNITICLIFILCIFLYSYLAFTKTAFHPDESFSFIIAEYKEIGLTKNLDPEKIYTGNEILSIFYGETASFCDAIDDIAKLYIDTRDSPHTNFYYSLLRLFCIGLEPSSLADVICRGEILNLALLVMTFMVMVAICNKLHFGIYGIITCLCFSFFSTSAFSNALLIRPYQLQTLFFSLITYTFIDLSERSQRKEIDTSILAQIKYAVILSLFLLSGYFSIFYGFAIFIVLLCSNKRNPEYIRFLVSVTILAFIFACILYPRYAIGFISYRATESLTETISNDFIENICLSFKGIISIILINFTSKWSILCIIIVFFIEKQKYKQHTYTISMLLCCSFFMIMTMIAAPYKALRYVMPIFPILSIVIAKICDSHCLFKKIVCTLLIGTLFYNAYNVYTYYLENYITFNKHLSVENAVIVAPTIWKMSTIIPFVSKNTRYRIYDICKNQNSIENYDAIYIEDSCTQNNLRSSPIKKQEFYFVYTKQ